MEILRKKIKFLSLIEDLILTRKCFFIEEQQKRKLIDQVFITRKILSK